MGSFILSDDKILYYAYMEELYVCHKLDTQTDISWRSNKQTFIQILKTTFKVFTVSLFNINGQT